MSKKLTILDRVTLPTPRFFRKVRTIGAALAAVGGVIAATPMPLPAVVVTIGGYLVLAGSVAAAVSSVAVEPESAQTQVDDLKEILEPNGKQHADAASL